MPPKPPPRADARVPGPAGTQLSHLAGPWVSTCPLWGAVVTPGRGPVGLVPRSLQSPLREMLLFAPGSRHFCTFSVAHGTPNPVTLGLQDPCHCGFTLQTGFPRETCIHTHHDAFLIYVYVFSFLFRAVPVACGGPQAGGCIRTAAAGLHHSHSNAGPSCIWDLRCSLWQRRILNPLSKARD